MEQNVNNDRLRENAIEILEQCFPESDHVRGFAGRYRFSQKIRASLDQEKMPGAVLALWNACVRYNEMSTLMSSLTLEFPNRNDVQLLIRDMESEYNGRGDNSTAVQNRVTPALAVIMAAVVMFAAVAALGYKAVANPGIEREEVSLSDFNKAVDQHYKADHVEHIQLYFKRCNRTIIENIKDIIVKKWDGKNLADLASLVTDTLMPNLCPVSRNHILCIKTTELTNGHSEEDNHFDFSRLEDLVGKRGPGKLDLNDWIKTDVERRELLIEDRRKQFRWWCLYYTVEKVLSKEKRLANAQLLHDKSKDVFINRRAHDDIQAIFAVDTGTSEILKLHQETAHKFVEFLNKQYQEMFQNGMRSDTIQIDERLHEFLKDEVRGK